MSNNILLQLIISQTKLITQIFLGKCGIIWEDNLFLALLKSYFKILSNTRECDLFGNRTLSAGAPGWVQRRKRVERFCAIYNTAIETVLYNINLVYIRNVNDLVWNIAVIDQNCFLSIKSNNSSHKGFVKQPTLTATGGGVACQ
jgi:hypothetical protein